MEGLLTLLALVVLAIPVLLVVALASIGGLKRRVVDLEDTVGQLRAGMAGLEGAGRGASAASVTAPADVRVAPNVQPQSQQHMQPQQAQESAPEQAPVDPADAASAHADRKSTRLNSSHVKTSYAVFC